jgi:hypothetical protein
VHRNSPTPVLLQRHLNRRTILSALHDAILGLLHVGNRIGDPDADADQRQNDPDRDNIHQHALAIIDGRFFFVSRHVVEWRGVGGGRGLQGRLQRRALAQLELQDLARSRRLAQIGLVLRHVEVTLQLPASIPRLRGNF